MEIIFYLIIVLLLLLLNGFFVLAEFASVKARPSQMDVCAAKGSKSAKIMQQIQSRLDEYLSVCQVGITLASIGLGFVGEPAFALFINPLLIKIGISSIAGYTSHALSIALAYTLVSYLHIVIGELLFKNVAINDAEKSALFIAYPLRIFYFIFWVPLRILNGSVNVLMRILGIPRYKFQDKHSESEIRLILDKSQTGGMMSFRRLLYIENILDMGALTVNNAMKPPAQVKSLKAGSSREESDKIIFESRYSRYLLLEDNSSLPLGYVHIKDIFLALRRGNPMDDLRSFVHPCLKAKETDPIDQLLSEMQKKANHIALVYDNKGQWTGFVTLEDLLEEIVGVIEEEFPLETPVYLSDTLTPQRIFLNVEGGSIVEAVWNTLSRLPQADLPLPLKTIMLSIIEREKRVSSYVGKKLAIPHARITGLKQPLIAVARLKKAIPSPVMNESIKLLFILLTPENMPRIHQIFLAHIAGIMFSEYAEDRFFTARTPAAVYEAIKTAEQTALS